MQETGKTYQGGQCADRHAATDADRDTGQVTPDSLFRIKATVTDKGYRYGLRLALQTAHIDSLEAENRSLRAAYKAAQAEAALYAKQLQAFANRCDRPGLAAALRAGAEGGAAQRRRCCSINPAMSAYNVTRRCVQELREARSAAAHGAREDAGSTARAQLVQEVAMLRQERQVRPPCHSALSQLALSQLATLPCSVIPRSRRRRPMPKRCWAAGASANAAS